MKSEAIAIPNVDPTKPARVKELTKKQWLAIGVRLKMIRREKNKRQIDVARAAKCTNDHVSRLEAGGRVLRPVLVRILAWLKKATA